MAIQKELWINKVQELLFPDNAFYKNAVDDSAFIEGHSVHVPQAGALNEAEKNRSSLPATIGSRTDVDLTYIVNEYSADPIVVTDIEETEASYGKMASVTSQMGKSIYNAIGTHTAYEWSTDVNVVETSGSNRTAYLSTQTGTRKTLVYADIVKAMGILNIQNVPMEGRKMLIDGYMYQDLMNMTQFTSSQTLMTGILTTGSIGTILGADVFVRTPSVIYDGSGAKKAVGATALPTDKLGLLVWHPDFVRIAMGNVKVFTDNEKPEYYGAVISSLVRSGAVKSVKTTDVGVVNIIEGA